MCFICLCLCLFCGLYVGCFKGSLWCFCEAWEGYGIWGELCKKTYRSYNLLRISSLGFGELLWQKPMEVTICFRILGLKVCGICGTRPMGVTLFLRISSLGFGELGERPMEVTIFFADFKISGLGNLAKDLWKSQSFLRISSLWFGELGKRPLEVTIFLWISSLGFGELGKRNLWKLQSFFRV